MTATNTTASTLIAAIDFSKHRHEVLIGVHGKKRRRRRGNVHCADRWLDVLDPVIARYVGRDLGDQLFRADAAYAIPAIYKRLEEAKFFYANRLPAALKNIAPAPGLSRFAVRSMFKQNARPQTPLGAKTLVQQSDLCKFHSERHATWGMSVYIPRSAFTAPAPARNG